MSGGCGTLRTMIGRVIGLILLAFATWVIWPMGVRFVLPPGPCPATVYHPSQHRHECVAR